MTEPELALQERVTLFGRALDRLDEVMAADLASDEMLQDAAVPRFESRRAARAP